MILDPGAITIFSLGPTGEVKLWDLKGLFEATYLVQPLGHIRDFAMALFVVLLGFEVARRMFYQSDENQWKGLFLRAAIVGLLVTSGGLYSTLMQGFAKTADSWLTIVATDNNKQESVWAFFDAASSAAVMTFDPSSTTSIMDLSVPDAFFFLFQLCFFVVWFTVPMLVCMVLQVLYVVGPLFIVFSIFQPLSGIARGWGKMTAALLCSFVLICVAFFILMGAGYFSLAIVAQRAMDPYTYGALVLSVVVIIFTIPGFVIRLFGVNFSLLGWKVI